MEKRELLYEGKAKKLFTTDDPQLLISEFKDDLTAFNGAKKASEAGKGALNNKISTELFKLIASRGVPTHFVRMLDDNHMLHKRVKVILIEVIVRNIATGSLSKNLGIEDGKVLPFTLVEFDYKNDALGDPKINDQHALIMGLVDFQDELDKIRRMARQVNDILKPYFAEKGLLVRFKLDNGVPQRMVSCHTALIDGYVIEGHVPAADIRRLLEERPDAVGLAVPGMPYGSPGMGPEDDREAYDVFLIRKDGSTEVFSSYAEG